MTGAVAGAISSAVYGGNWGKNMLEGAQAGLIGAGIGMATKQVLGSIKKLDIVHKAVDFTQQMIKSIGQAAFIALTDIGKFLVGNVIGLAFEPWVAPATGGIPIPKSMREIIDEAYGRLSDKAAKYGYHEWHGGSSAGIASKLGPLGAAVIWVAGVIHEIDPKGIKDELEAQGVVNWAIDSVGDIVANTLGVVGGLASPLSVDRGIDIGRFFGGSVIGPRDPWTFNSAGREYTGNPLDAWKY